MTKKVHQAICREGPVRLDRVLVDLFGESLSLSRAQAEKWIEQGCVSVNGKVIEKPAHKVGAGEGVEVRPLQLPPSHLEPLDISLEVLFEDQHLIVVNKPAGLSMHPGAGNSSRTLANAIVAHVGPGQRQVGESDRPGIVHRLDKDTTGLVVVAKSTPVLADLSRQFAERTIDRTYEALVYTTPRAVRVVQKSDAGVVSAAIGRHVKDRRLMAISERGKMAVTHWKAVERFSYGTLLECKLETGRTHQIRVHMNSIGSPVIGDVSYGDFSNLPNALRDAARELGRQALHAKSLSFTHPITQQRMSFSAPTPSDMANLIQFFRAF